MDQAQKIPVVYARANFSVGLIAELSSSIFCRNLKWALVNLSFPSFNIPDLSIPQKLDPTPSLQKKWPRCQQLLSPFFCLVRSMETLTKDILLFFIGAKASGAAGWCGDERGSGSEKFTGTSLLQNFCHGLWHLVEAVSNPLTPLRIWNFLSDLTSRPEAWTQAPTVIHTHRRKVRVFGVT